MTLLGALPTALGIVSLVGGVFVVCGAVVDVWGGVFVLSLMGVALDGAGGGVFALIAVGGAVGDVGVFRLFAGEENEASWIGFILLEVFPVDCRGSAIVSIFEGEGVPLCSTAITFFSNGPFFTDSPLAFSSSGDACFFSDLERRLGGSSVSQSGVPSSPSEKVTTEQ